MGILTWLNTQTSWAIDPLTTYGYRAPYQYPKRRLFVRSRKVWKPRDWYFKLSYRFEIWQAHRQHCCRSACQTSERSDNSKYKSRGFETLRKDVFSDIETGPRWFKTTDEITAWVSYHIPPKMGVITFLCTNIRQTTYTGCIYIELSERYYTDKNYIPQKIMQWNYSSTP